ncbi:MAG: CRTAC1 family protein [Planctomycetota bacterium]
MLRNVIFTFVISNFVYEVAHGGLVCDAGICFVDRAVTGEIVLGAYTGGIAVLDYDRDGYVDLVVGNVTNQPKRLFRNVPDPLRPGQRTLVDVTAGSGLDDADGRMRNTIGVVVADYNNDGWLDVFMIARRSEPDYGVLYRNNGDGTFTNVTLAAGVRMSGSGAEAASWCDYDLDGYPDLLLAQTSAPYVRLMHNTGDGTFTERAALLPTIPGFTACYSLGWMDFDRDGWPDCFLLSNRGAGTEVLLHNISDEQGGRRFENVAQARGYVNHGPAPMGIAFGDYDGDGWLDLGISDAVTGTYYRNLGGSFQKVALFATMFGWGVEWLDVDNDGWLDFYTAGSWGTARFDNLQRNLGGGQFADISPQLNGIAAATKYSVQLDLNNDGRRDIIALVPGNFVSVYENVSTTPGHWLSVELRGDGRHVHTAATNAVVRLTAGGRTQVQEVVSGSSTTSTEDLRLHFGLGAATQVDQIEVLWPRRGTLAARTEVYAGPFAADQFALLEPQIVAGDLNCDGLIDFADINPFVLALGGRAGYEATYPDCNWLNADANGDAQVDFEDINAFVALLDG